MQPPAPISALLRAAAGRLAAIGAGNPLLEAEYLMEKALGWDRVRLLAREDLPLAPEVEERFEGFLHRRMAREPLQYILGSVPFCDCDLAVGRGVLIPRSETEILVEQVVRAVSSGAAPVSLRGRAPLLVDLGTGSAAILLACLHRLPGWRGVGLDRSRGALSWARRNRDQLSSKVGDKLQASAAELIVCDWGSALSPRSAQVVVSNPPYIRSCELDSLAPEIRAYEPCEALDGGESGLVALSRVIEEARRLLTAGGLLAMECGPDQAEGLARLVEADGAFREPAAFQDLAGRARGVLARRT
jgi:release factor glutamine methyltransferase